MRTPVPKGPIHHLKIWMHSRPEFEGVHRLVQQHVGELMERLGTRENIEVDWVFSRPD